MGLNSSKESGNSNNASVPPANVVPNANTNSLNTTRKTNSVPAAALGPASANMPAAPVGGRRKTCRRNHRNRHSVTTRKH